MQSRTLGAVGCHTMADMAYVIPDVVLPLAYERFQVWLPVQATCTFGLKSQRCGICRLLLQHSPAGKCASAVAVFRLAHLSGSNATI